jgi:hypothetical protein
MVLRTATRRQQIGVAWQNFDFYSVRKEPGVFPGSGQEPTVRLRTHTAPGTSLPPLCIYTACANSPNGLEELLVFIFPPLNVRDTVACVRTHTPGGRMPVKSVATCKLGNRDTVWNKLHKLHGCDVCGEKREVGCKDPSSLSQRDGESEPRYAAMGWSLQPSSRFSDLPNERRRVCVVWYKLRVEVGLTCKPKL